MQNKKPRIVERYKVFCGVVKLPEVDFYRINLFMI